jgi:hypothetical protein
LQTDDRKGLGILERRSGDNRRTADRKAKYISADQLLKNGKAALQEIKTDYPKLKSAYTDLLHEVKKCNDKIIQLSEKLKSSEDADWKERASKAKDHIEQERDAMLILIEEAGNLLEECIGALKKKWILRISL